jgi:hypothetical protein
MEIRDVPVDDVVLDPNLNLRDRLDPETVERYCDCWDRLPPITLFEVDGRWLLADGFHRYAAAATLKKRTIPAEVRPGAFEDALDFAAGVNLFHGLPLTRAERRRVVEVKLRLHGAWSDRRLSEELGISRELIAKVRKQLVDSGQIPLSDTRVGSDGKSYPSQGLPRDPNERLPRTNAAGGADDDRPADRGRPQAPWDDATTPLPPVETPAGLGGHPIVPPWEVADAKKLANSGPVPVATPTVEEMLKLMTQQVGEVLGWCRAEGFAEAVRHASAVARREFVQSTRDLARLAETVVGT